MALYKYQALDVKGKLQKGSLEADSEKNARDRLREQGLMLKNLSLASASSSGGHLRGDDLLTFTMQLSQMLQAGMPLFESLASLEEHYRGEKFHTVLVSLCEAIKRGDSLSQAMSQSPRSFDTLYSAMVAAGEASGTLPSVVEKLSALISRQLKLRKQIITALIYPALLGGFALVIIFLLLSFVIPSLESIFGDRKVNGFTAVIIAVSHFLNRYWPVYLPLFGGLGLYAYIKLRSAEMKKKLLMTVSRLPVLRTLGLQTALARFSRTLATLQQGGLPIIDSLRIARRATGHPQLEAVVEQAEARIIEGSSLSRELKQSALVPPLVTRMLAVGEETGDTATMLRKIADIYEDDIEKTLQRITALAQPIILVVMGAIVGVVMLSILLPLTDISAFTQ